MQTIPKYHRTRHDSMYVRSQRHPSCVALVALKHLPRASGRAHSLPSALFWAPPRAGIHADANNRKLLDAFSKTSHMCSDPVVINNLMHVAQKARKTHARAQAGASAHLRGFCAAARVEDCERAQAFFVAVHTFFVAAMRLHAHILCCRH
eukprot:2394684-Pleurochrysis_carterae.AAC.2